MVVDISHVKVGRYVHDFGVLYGKMGVVLGGVGVWGLGLGGWWCSLYIFVQNTLVVAYFVASYLVNR